MHLPYHRHRSHAPPRVPRGPQPPLGDYALLGDGAGSALVSRDSAVDWMCVPRFDSAPIFCRMLDWERGGTFRVGPLGAHETAREYVKGTHVLTTEHTTARGNMRLTDFLSLAGGGPRTPEWRTLGGSRLLRCVEGLSGEVELEIRFHPTFDFARHEPRFERGVRGAVAWAGSQWLALQCPAPLEADDRGGLRGTLRLHAGQRLWLVLEQGEGKPPENFGMADQRAEEELRKTLVSWRRISDAWTYEGPYQEQVRRSGLVEGVLHHANDLGLLSEEIDADTGELRGNFPQALSHLGLIRSAHLIDEAERRREHGRQEERA